VVNNSGHSLFQVKIGRVMFKRNLSRCSDGCSTGFKQVREGKSSIAVKAGRRADWEKLGTLGRFEQCKKYAVNIVSRGGSVCAQLAERRQTDSTYNRDRTKRVIDETCARLGPGTWSGARPGQGQARPIQPELVRRGKSILLRFPVQVRNVTVYDHNSVKIRHFEEGKVFDMTEYLPRMTGDHIEVSFLPADAERQTGVSKRLEPDWRRMLRRRIIELAEIPYIREQLRVSREDDIDGPSDLHEPENNTIDNAVQVNWSTVTGSVGAEGDSDDYFKVSSSPVGYGTYIQVTRQRGNIRLYSYDPIQDYLDSHEESLWIALEPNSSFYVQVEPQTYSETEYELRIEKHIINDHMEPNDDFSQSKPIDAPGKSVLCNVITSHGTNKGIQDFYSFEMYSPKIVRVNVNNAGVAAGVPVKVRLHDPDEAHIHTGEVTSGDTFVYDAIHGYRDYPFPPGSWRIEVKTNSESDAAAYGVGDGPDCYTDPSGYSVNLELIE
jgi:hypothetical protein